MASTPKGSPLGLLAGWEDLAIPSLGSDNPSHGPLKSTGTDWDPTLIPPPPNTSLKDANYSSVQLQLSVTSQRERVFSDFQCSFWAFLAFCFAELGLELRAYTLSHSTSPFCDGFFRDRVSPRSHQLFAWAGFKLQSS
jgi:hypothetical protein